MKETGSDDGERMDNEKIHGADRVLCGASAIWAGRGLMNHLCDPRSRFVGEVEVR